MTTKKLIGIIILTAIFAGLFAITAIEKGVVDAALLWIISGSLLALTILAIKLVTE